MPGSHSATLTYCTAQPTLAGGALAGVLAHREQLTLLLRGLAADLDELDRRLSDLTWRQRVRPSGTAAHDQTALLTRREQLTTRLRALAGQLSELDNRAQQATRVGTCPHCGYPSLDSGLCAFCRPFVAR